MTREQLLDRFRKERTAHEAWADHLIKEILHRMEDENILTDYFLKIPPKFRYKDEESFINKALNRGKNYTNPYEDISDKIGFRLVVLTEKDLKKVKQIVMDIDFASCSEDKDYEEERKSQPLLFTYQSKHYVLRPKEVMNLGDNIEVNPLIACEIQARTILQHAHAELSHKIIYKSTFVPKDKAKTNRILARSVALIETIDQNFIHVVEELEEIQKPTTDILSLLNAAYAEKFSGKYDSQLNGDVAYSVLELLGNTSPEQIMKIIQDKPNIWTWIENGRNRNKPFYDIPAIIMMYYAASKLDFADFSSSFIYEDNYLKNIYTDLGKATN